MAKVACSGDLARWKTWSYAPCICLKGSDGSVKGNAILLSVTHLTFSTISHVFYRKVQPVQCHSNSLWGCAKDFKATILDRLDVGSVDFHKFVEMAATKWRKMDH